MSEERRRTPWWAWVLLMSGGGTLVTTGVVDRLAATVSVDNFPTVQTVEGTVKVSNLPPVEKAHGSVTVSNFPPTQAVHGEVKVSNLGDLKVPATVEVSNLPTVQAVEGSMDISNFPEVQEVKGTVDIGERPPPSSFTLVGFTASTYPSNAGVLAFTLGCGAQFGGSRMCTVGEVVRTTRVPPLGGTEVAWVNPERGIADSCGGWTDNTPDSTGFGVSRSGQFPRQPCNTLLSVACCARVTGDD